MKQFEIIHTTITNFIKARQEHTNQLLKGKTIVITDNWSPTYLNLKGTEHIVEYVDVSGDGLYLKITGYDELVPFGSWELVK